MDYIDNLLLKPLDRVATSRNVTRFFKKDYLTMVERSGQSLCSPAMDGMPQAPSFENTADDRLIERMQAKYERDVVIYTVSTLDVKSQFIIKNKFLISEPKLDFQIGKELGYSKSGLRILKQNALIKFAEKYQRLDLRVFRNIPN